MVKVSVIVPIYGVEKYLREALDSVLNQTLSDIEIILIDDGSKDNCPQIIDEYAKKDSRIIAIHKENGGYGNAVNTGLERATGEYVAIFEPDDYLELSAYEIMYKQAKKLDLDICTSGFYVYNSKESESYQNTKWQNEQENIEEYPSDRAFTIKEFPKLFIIHASLWTKLFKRSFLLENNIKVNSTQGASYQDFPFMAETMCRASRIGVVHEYLYHWRVEPTQNSSTSRKDARLMIMADQCEEVKRIVKEQGLYDILKEPMYRHFTSANYAFYKVVKFSVKKEYFKKLYHLYKELNEDKEFKYRYFQKQEEDFVKKVLTNKFWKTVSFRALRKTIISIRWNKTEKRIIFFERDFTIKGL